MAPYASEGTTLQEYAGTNTVAVVYAKLLYIEDDSHFLYQMLVLFGEWTDRANILLPGS